MATNSTSIVLDAAKASVIETIVAAVLAAPKALSREAMRATLKKLDLGASVADKVTAVLGAKATDEVKAIISAAKDGIEEAQLDLAKIIAEAIGWTPVVKETEQLPEVVAEVAVEAANEADAVLKGLVFTEELEAEILRTMQEGVEAALSQKRAVADLVPEVATEAATEEVADEAASEDPAFSYDSSAILAVVLSELMLAASYSEEHVDELFNDAVEKLPSLLRGEVKSEMIDSFRVAARSFIESYQDDNYEGSLVDAVVKAVHDSFGGGLGAADIRTIQKALRTALGLNRESLIAFAAANVDPGECCRKPAFVEQTVHAVKTVFGLDIYG